MGVIRTLARHTFRNFITDGLPSSGDHEPEKPEIRALFDLIEDQATATEGMQGNGVVGYRNYSGTPGLAADLLHAAGTKGEVWQQAGTHTDPATSGSVANIGTYEKRLGSGLGDWAWMGALDVTSLGTRMTAAEADINSLETDVGGLLSDMTTAQGDISAEATARAAADTTLTTNLASEATARTAAVSTLTTNLASEATTRGSADTALTASIASEATARAAAITALLTSSAQEVIDGTNTAHAVTPANLAALRVDTYLDIGVLASSDGGATFTGTLQQADFSGQIADRQKIRLRFAVAPLADAKVTIDSAPQWNLGNETGGAIALDDLQPFVTYFGRFVLSTATLRLDINESLAIREAVDSEATTRATADNAIGDLIDDEATARAAAISAEATTRATNDNTIGTSISAEATTRASADTALSASIASEASTRASADTAETASRIAVDATKGDIAPSPSPVANAVAQGRPLLTSEDGIVLLMQRFDGSTAVGPIPAADWHVEVRGAVGSRHVWAMAEGVGPAGYWEFQVSIPADGDDNFAPKLEGIRLSWIAESGGVRSKKTAIMAAGISGLSFDVTTMRGVHILGQSTSNGNVNAAAITTAAPAPTQVFMPEKGIRALGNEQLDIRREEPLRDETIQDFLPALERVHLSSGETGWAVAASDLVALYTSSLGAFVATLGIGSVPYDSVKLGTVPFDNLLKLIRRERIAANVNGRDYEHPTMWHMAHEGWTSSSQASILADILEAQVNYTAEINKITGASGEVLLLMDGLASSGHYNALGGATQTTPVVPWAVLQAAIANPTKVVAVVPRYIFAHLVDDVHPTAQGCLDRAPYFARAEKRALAGSNALPLYMTSAVKTASTVITLTFNVWPGYEPVRSLNTDICTNPGNSGIEYSQTGGSLPTIVSVVDGPSVNEITVTMSGNVDLATNPKIRIASQAINDTGPTGGPRSTITDEAPDGHHNPAWPQEIAVT